MFGDVEAETAGEVLRNWDQIKQASPGASPAMFGEVPENLPAPLYARKVQRRAASSGFDFAGVEGRLQSCGTSSTELEAAGDDATSASTSSATCCSRRSTWRAS